MAGEPPAAEGPEGAAEEGGADGDDTLVEQRETIVAAARHGERLDKAVVAFVPEFSRSHLQALIKAGWVQLDGAACASAGAARARRPAARS